MFKLKQFALVASGGIASAFAAPLAYRKLRNAYWRLRLRNEETGYKRPKLLIIGSGWAAVSVVHFFILRCGSLPNLDRC